MTPNKSTASTSNLEKASKILNSGLALADERLTNENRIRYLIACALAALGRVIVALGLWLPPVRLQPVWRFTEIFPLKEAMPYLLAAAGASGAVFSIAMRIQHVDLKPFAHTVMNYLMGVLRVLTGFLAGAMILLIVKATVLGSPIAKLFEGKEALSDWKCIILIGFIGGFAERLVPVLLGSLQRGVEPSSAKGSGNVVSRKGTAERRA